jgi:hypothetical protein
LCRIKDFFKNIFGILKVFSPFFSAIFCKTQIMKFKKYVKIKVDPISSAIQLPQKSIALATHSAIVHSPENSIKSREIHKFNSRPAKGNHFTHKKSFIPPTHSFTIEKNKHRRSSWWNHNR